MISPRLLRRRIKSIQNTAKITKAMEMIATAKMRRAQEQALAGRPYAEKIAQVISDLAVQYRGISQEVTPDSTKAVGRQTHGSAPTEFLATGKMVVGQGTHSYPVFGEVRPQDEDAKHPLLVRREVRRIGVVYITTDRGLCGGLNANMNRYIGNFILKIGKPVSFITVGRKGRDFILRCGQELRAEFSGVGDKPTLLDTLPISRIVMDDYSNSYIDAVYIAYPRFSSIIIQTPTMEALLPVEPAVSPGAQSSEYIYEPSARFILSQLLPRFVQMEVYHAILEAIASEYAARMVAMRNATDNAEDLIGDLTISLNKARQEMITKELLDITGCAEALGK